MSDGQRAFEAYRAHRNGLTHDGAHIPEWSGLGQDIQDAWESAADAVLDLYRGQDCV